MPRRLHWNVNRRFPAERRIRTYVFVGLLISFLLGSAIGCYTGSSADGAGIASSDLLYYASEPSGFFSVLLKLSRFHIAAILAATSTIGLFAVFLISLLRGYVLTCAMAVIQGTLPDHGMAAAWLICGISAVITIPSLFLLELDGFEGSVNLRQKSVGSDTAVDNQLLHGLITAVSLFLAAWVEYAWIPALVNRLLS